MNLSFTCLPWKKKVFKDPSHPSVKQKLSLDLSEWSMPPFGKKKSLLAASVFSQRTCTACTSHRRRRSQTFGRKTRFWEHIPGSLYSSWAFCWEEWEQWLTCRKRKEGHLQVIHNAKQWSSSLKRKQKKKILTAFPAVSLYTYHSQRPLPLCPSAHKTWLIYSSSHPNAIVS